MAGKQSGNRGSPQVGCWQAIRDVLIASMARGQFLLAAAFFVLFVVVLRLPGEHLATLVFRVLDGLQSWSYVGWALFIVTAFGWVANARFLRRINAQELARIAEAKTEAQQKQLGNHVRSSEA